MNIPLTEPGSGPLRIIQVVNVRWFNATAWYGLYLSWLLREAGYDIRVLGLDGTESFAKAQEWGLAPEPLDLNSANPLVVARVFSRMRRLVREFRPHVVNCHRGEGFALWGMLKQFGKYGLVRTRGDQRPPKANPVNTYLHAKLADAVIATSSSIAVGMRDILGVPENRVHTIFGGVDTRRFYPDPAGRETMRTTWGLGAGQVAIGLVGRFDAVKGQKEMIQSFALLRQALGSGADNCRLVLAGFATSSVSEDAVRGWVRDAELEKWTIFPGRCMDARSLMNALDLGVVASLGSETIARVALEIMACAVPLVGTRVGVMPDLMEDEALAKPGDIRAMACILSRFVTDGAFGISLREAQTRRMRTLTECDFREQTLAVYRGVCSLP